MELITNSSVHTIQPLVPILSQINPVHVFHYYLRSILILSCNLSLRLASGLLTKYFAGDKFKDEEFGTYLEGLMRVRGLPLISFRWI
jgi:hypothetical protein